MPSGVILLPLASTSPEHVVASIEAAVKAVSPDIILPVSEETLFRIWDEAPDWPPLVQPAIEPDNRALYRNKHLLGAFVQAKGILIPRTHRLKNGTSEEFYRSLPILDYLLWSKAPAAVEEVKYGSRNLMQLHFKQLRSFVSAREKYPHCRNF